MNKNLSNNLQKKFLLLVPIIIIISLILILFIGNLNAASFTSENFTVDYTVQNDWGNGAVINIDLINNGPTVNGWSITWTFPDNQKITNMWNATYSQSGSDVTVNNSDWNTSIPSNGSQSFGFTISYSSSNTSPTNFIVNSSSTTTTTPIITETAFESVEPSTTTAAPTTSTNTSPNEGTFHVFLLLGQSNMAGYPAVQDSDKVPDDRIIVLDYTTNQWRTAIPPLHSTWGNAIGPGDWFSKTIVDYIPDGDTIGLIPCAISGERIETFMKVDGVKYSWIIDRSKMAQEKGGIIEGILFNQGESNNGDSKWPGNVNTLITDIRTDLNIGNVPFLAGELLYSGSCAGHNVLINQLPSVVNNCYVISANGLVVDPIDTEWKLHFDHDSQVIFGKRYAQTMIEALGW